jgi:hypothetical protein
MPLGPDRCNGPSGYMYSTIPPPALMRTEGSISNCNHYIHVGFYICITTVTHYHFAAINIVFALVVIWTVIFLWILYFGVVYRYRLRYF